MLPNIPGLPDVPVERARDEVVPSVGREDGQGRKGRNLQDLDVGGE